ncbi:MAG: MnmC family methyltransferase [Pseudobdellovibrio sp.]
MKNSFEQIRFELEITKDGSPTLRLPNSGESMHHSGGAASETLYIYKSVIDQALEKLKTSKTCVVGLGMGYIEISWALALLEQNKASDLHTITSFEIVEELRNSFKSWLSEDSPAIYDEVVKAFRADDKSKSIKNILNRNSIEFDILNFSEKQKWNIICYDAYSSKTEKILWSEEFLNQFLQQHAAEDCIFTTYACTGVLKKVLAANHFEIIRRPAFSGKGSHCTMAHRGIFKTGC